MKLDGVLNEGIAPHPAPLPMGEGTLEFSLRIVQGSLLPWGEGQDEGRFPAFVAPSSVTLAPMGEGGGPVGTALYR